MSEAIDARGLVAHTQRTYNASLMVVGEKMSKVEALVVTKPVRSELRRRSHLLPPRLCGTALPYHSNH